MCRDRDIDARIHRHCMLAMTDEETMEALGGKLLNAFHEVCTCTTNRANDMVREICYYDGEIYDPCEDTKVMESALVRLEFFSQESRKDQYERQIQSILSTGHMIRIMEALKGMVYNYSKHGPEFVSILSTCYMNSFDYTNEEVYELLNMSSSSFYRKKRRAVILFGLAFLEYKARFMGAEHIDCFDQEGTQIKMAI